MKKSAIIIFLILFCSLASVVIAPPPAGIQSSQDLTGELTILYPKEEAFILNNPASNLHFHVFNSSGKLLGGGEVICRIHIYNSSNNHVIKSNLTPETEDLAYEGIPTAYVGSYAYNVWCNSTEGEYGFISAEYAVRAEGRDYATNWGIILVVGMLGIAALMLFIAFKIEEQDFLKVAMKLLFFGFALFFMLSTTGLLNSLAFSYGATTSTINLVESQAAAMVWLIRFTAALLGVYMLWVAANGIREHIKIRR